MDKKFYEELLQTLNKTKQEIDFQEPQAVRGAREHGMTWQEIGNIYGLTRQGAHAKWSKNLGKNL